jgi:ketosteroid isomerase-like protein
MENILAEQVRARVHAFWEHYCSKSKADFEGVYFPEATILEIDARRIEPARLMVARRVRELFSNISSVSAEIGTIDVQVLEPSIAVAAYGFRFRVVRVMANGKRFESDIRVARATHIFQRDQDGALRIVHEHMSSGTVSPPKEVADTPGATK